MASFFGFPNPVNETSARIVAAGAVVMGALFVATGNGWILVPLTYGFIARVLSGPKFSPLGLIATQVITPRIKVQHRFVAGPPKRFAQGVGAGRIDPIFLVERDLRWQLIGSQPAGRHFAGGIDEAGHDAAVS